MPKHVSSVAGLILLAGLPTLAHASDAGASLIVVGDPRLPEVRHAIGTACGAIAKSSAEPVGDRGDRVSVELEPGALNWVRMSAGAVEKNCEVTYAFVPEASSVYAAKFAERDSKCTAVLFRMMKAAERVREPIAANAGTANELLCAATAGPAAESRIAVVKTGGDSRVLVGQEGYCGKMREVDLKGASGAVIKSNTRNWIRFVGSDLGMHRECELDFSFVPTGGGVYVVQANFGGRQCSANLSRIAPGRPAALVPLTPEKRQFCLLHLNGW
jgi:hypothetical protein